MSATPVNPPPEWGIEDAYAEHGRFKAYRAKHPRETARCEDNLRRVVTMLQLSGSPTAFRFNFFRRETGDVWRVGQTALAGAKETRLYVYVRIRGRTVYKLTIGGKERQTADIRRAAAIAERIDTDLKREKK